MSQEITLQCPGCNRIRTNGRWVQDKPAADTEVKLQICVSCRASKDIRRELLNEGIVVSPPR